MNFSAALDGELLVGDPREATGTFSDLQQRLNRKTVSPKIREKFPAFMRCYDILQLGDEDLRPLPFTERRKRLESLHRHARPDTLRPLAARAFLLVGGAERDALPIRRIRSSRASC